MSLADITISQEDVSEKALGTEEKVDDQPDDRWMRQKINGGQHLKETSRQQHRPASTAASCDMRTLYINATPQERHRQMAVFMYT
jgi:hypothetical protein